MVLPRNKHVVHAESPGFNMGIGKDAEHFEKATDCKGELEEENEDEPGIFNLDGDVNSMTSDKEGGCSTPELANSEDEEQADQGQMCSDIQGRGLDLFTLDIDDDDDDLSLGPVHDVGDGAFEEEKHSGQAITKGLFSEGPSGLPLGTSPTLQLALKQLAAQGPYGKELGAASEALLQFAMKRQTTI